MTERTLSFLQEGMRGEDEKGGGKGKYGEGRAGGRREERREVKGIKQTQPVVHSVKIHSWVCSAHLQYELVTTQIRTCTHQVDYTCVDWSITVQYLPCHMVASHSRSDRRCVHTCSDVPTYVPVQLNDSAPDHIQPSAQCHPLVVLTRVGVAVREQ